MSHHKLQHYKLEPIGDIDPADHAEQSGFLPDGYSLAFACTIQDNDTLETIQEVLGDTDITAVMVGTHSGDYDPVYVRYNLPSFRDSNDWLIVRWGESKINRTKGDDDRPVMPVWVRDKRGLDELRDKGYSGAIEIFANWSFVYGTSQHKAIKEGKTRQIDKVRQTHIRQMRDKLVATIYADYSVHVWSAVRALWAHLETREERADLAQYGAGAGWSGFIYTSDTMVWYDLHETAIWELLARDADSLGLGVLELVATFEASDICDIGGFKRLLTWYAIETLARVEVDHYEGDTR